MAMGQDRLTFYGVLVAIVIAIVGYFQIGKLYPVTGHAAEGQQASSNATDLEDGAETGVSRPEEDVE